MKIIVSFFIVFASGQLSNAQTIDCDYYLRKSDSVLNKSTPNLGMAKKYLKAFTICLGESNTPDAKIKIKNLENYELISVSMNGAWAWGKDKFSKKYYLLDGNYRLVKILNCAAIYPFGKANICIVKSAVDSKLGVLYSDGHINYNYNNIQCNASWDEGLLLADKTNSTIILNQNGNEILIEKYDYIECPQDGMFPVEKNNKWGFLNSVGKEAISVKYDWVSNFSEGLAAVERDGKQGFVNKDGNELIPLKYDEVHPFSEGLARVKVNGKCGYLDKSGNVLILIIYDLAASFSNGIALVQLANKKFYINKKGEKVKDAN